MDTYWELEPDQLVYNTQRNELWCVHEDGYDWCVMELGDMPSRIPAGTLWRESSEFVVTRAEAEAILIARGL